MEASTSEHRGLRVISGWVTAHATLFLIVCLGACNQVAEGLNPADYDLTFPASDIELISTDPDLSFEVDTVYYFEKPYTGSVIEMSDSVLLSRKQYENGVMHGLYEAFYSNGEIQHLRTYVKGEKHGIHRGWYPDGRLKFEYLFVDGYSEGNHRQWYNNGQLYSSMNYVRGKERGTQQVYREDGKLRSNYVVRDNGRKYGLVGLKRCKNIDTENERLRELQPSS